MTVRIRPMTTGDVDGATAALVRGDWGDRREWWRFVVDHPACSPIVAVDGDAIVGTGVGTVHGTVGWVGTIYVVPERRRQGLGMELSRVVCDGLEAAGCRTLVLAATPEGARVYERLGFETVSWYRILGRDGVAPGLVARPRNVRRMRDDDLPAIAALDAEVTGEDRSATLDACLGTPGGLVVEGRAGALDGFLLRAPWHGAALIAPGADAAQALLEARLLDAGPGHPVRAGLLEENEVGRRRLLDRGWEEHRRIARMHRGAPLAWRREAIWGQLGFALG
jgi:ribosomal protein S18 acetylase RimI-like enzyme